jgi:hypothetical protein
MLHTDGQYRKALRSSNSTSTEETCNEHNAYTCYPKDKIIKIMHAAKKFKGIPTCKSPTSYSAKGRTAYV